MEQGASQEAIAEFGQARLSNQQRELLSLAMDQIELRRHEVCTSSAPPLYSAAPHPRPLCTPSAPPLPVFLLDSRLPVPVRALPCARPSPPVPSHMPTRAHPFPPVPFFAPTRSHRYPVHS